MEALLVLVFFAGVLWIPYKIYKVLYVGEKPSENQSYDGWKCPKCGLINNLKDSTSCFCGYDKNKPVIEKREINPADLNTQKIIKPTPYEAPPASNKFDDFENLSQAALKSALFEKNLALLKTTVDIEQKIVKVSWLHGPTYRAVTTCRLRLH